MLETSASCPNPTLFFQGGGWLPNSTLLVRQGHVAPCGVAKERQAEVTCLTSSGIDQEPVGLGSGTKYGGVGDGGCL